VAGVRRALHIRTGDPALGAPLDDWLRAHQVEIAHCDDALDACAHLLMHGDALPDLALIGTDRLASDELSILRYLREVWPGVAILLYGHETAVAWADPSGLSRRSGSRAAMRELLAGTPADLLESIRMSSQGSPVASRREPEPSETGVPPPDREVRERASPSNSTSESVGLEAPPRRFTGRAGVRTDDPDFGHFPTGRV
jgi:hypothetical protein